MKFRISLVIGIAAAGIFAVVFLTRKSPARQGNPGADPPAVSLEVEIKHVEVRPAGDHAQLILTAVFEQSGKTPVRLEPPLVSLLTANQTPAARFIGPMLPEPVLTGSGPAEITLHYWLPLSDLKTPLILQASGRNYPLPLPKP